MELIRGRKSLIFIIAAFFPLLLSLPPAASAEGTFSRIVVFGTSLSDPGNAFAIWHEKSTPPYDTLDQFAIPDHPYAKSGLHYTNGATWIEQFSRPLGLAGSVRPAFAARGGEASNYAVGRARAREDAGTAGFINLPAQVSAFLSDHSGTAPADALYVVEIGSNDLKDALESFAAGRDGGAIIADALSSIGGNLERLYASGARRFLVWNVPDIGLTPALRTLDKAAPGVAQSATLLSAAFNANLDMLLGYLQRLPGIEIVRLDAKRILSDLARDPAAFGLVVADAACVTPNVPPFECREPDAYLFWDGIHPTRAVHGMIAQNAAVGLSRR
ncbi:MAG: GDSL family lipase [Nitrospirae bacterium GWC2_57_9]|nr:MAG: GDSL family lipase [Nitrospirae bacterium GWC2_57_9]